MSERDLDRLAAHVKERRLALGGMTQSEAAAAAGVSDTTWNQVEAGKAVNERSMMKIDRGLGWRPGSCEQIVRGGEPTPAEPVTRDPQADLLLAVQSLTEAVQELRADLRQGRT